MIFHMKGREIVRGQEQPESVVEPVVDEPALAVADYFCAPLGVKLVDQIWWFCHEVILQRQREPMSIQPIFKEVHVIGRSDAEG